MIPPFIVPESMLGAVDRAVSRTQCFEGMVFNLGGLEVKKAVPCKKSASY